MRQRDDWHLTDLIHSEPGMSDPFAAAIRATRMPMIITDARQFDNPIVFANEAFQTLTGYGRDEVIGRNCRFLQGPETNRETVTQLKLAIAAKVAIQVDILNYRKDGSTFWNALYISPTLNEAGDVQFHFASQLDVTERIVAQQMVSRQKAIVEEEVRRRTAELEGALQAKTMLLHEVDHRVKNNLTLIGSLLRLQSRQINDPQISAKLDAMLERVDALASVHRRLYQSDDVTKFNIAAFAETLATNVVGVSGRTDIKVVVNVDRLDIASTQAASVGLILNELITNALKHGFHGDRGGELTICATPDTGGIALSIADNGRGRSLAAETIDGFGTTLVKRLIRQLHGKVVWETLDPGTKVTLTLPFAS